MWRCVRRAPALATGTLLTRPPPLLPLPLPPLRVALASSWSGGGVCAAPASMSHATRQSRHRAIDSKMTVFLRKKRFDESVLAANSLEDLSKLVEHQESSAGKLSARNVSLIIFQSGRLGEHQSSDQDAIRSQLIDLVSSRITEFNVESTSSMLRAFASWQWDIPADLVRTLAKRVVSVPRLRGKLLARTTRAIAALNINDDSIWQKLMIMLKRQLPHLDHRELSLALLGVEQSGHGDCAFFDAVISHAVPRLLSFDANALCGLSLSVTRAAYPSENAPSRVSDSNVKLLLHSVADACIRIAPLLTSSQMSMLATAFGRAGCAHAALFEKLHGLFLTRMGEFSNQQGDTMIWAFETLNLDHSKLSGAFDALKQQRLDN